MAEEPESRLMERGIGFHLTVPHSRLPPSFHMPPEPNQMYISSSPPQTSSLFVLCKLFLSRHFNDRAVYTCDDGYQIVGLEQVICNSDGQWSGNQPSCKQASANSQSRYYCGEPKHIPNAKHNGSKEQVRDVFLRSKVWL